MNVDLELISPLAYQWKISFRPDISKQAHRVIFSKKMLTWDHKQKITFFTFSVFCPLSNLTPCSPSPSEPLFLTDNIKGRIANKIK